MRFVPAGGTARGSVAAKVVTAMAIVAILAVVAPSALLIGTIALVAAATLWLAFDLAAAARPLMWSDYRTADPGSAEPDGRVQALRSRLHRSSRTPLVLETGDAEPDDAIADTLVGVIDDHLLTQHDVDRVADPDAAATLLGPELMRFVSDPAARRSMTRRRVLARTLSLIEDL